jgi:hypothetical protein
MFVVQFVHPWTFAPFLAELNGFNGSGLGRWDISAGASIAEAAGATVVQLYSELLPNPLLVVANPGLLEALVAALVTAGATCDSKAGS